VPIWAQPSPISPADADERRIIEGRFNSSEPADLAWAAHLAANYRQPSYVPRIIELLQHSDRDVRLVALDALIRLRATVPWESLAPLVNRHFDAVVILASINNENRPYLSELLDGKVSDIGWVALNGILVDGRHPAGYAARLLKQWRPSFPIGVGALPPEPPPSGGMCGDSFQRPRPRPGFPPVVFYQFQQRTLALNFTTGPHSVSYTASTTTSGCFFPISRDTYTLDYLRWLTGLNEDVLPCPKPLLIKWTGSAQYRRSVLGYQEQIRTFVTRIRDALVARGLIAPDETVAMPVLDVVIHDLRTDKSAPLPVFDWRL